MQSSYVHAAIYSLLSVAIVLMLDFRSVRYTLLSMVPLGPGVVQLFGLLGLLDIPLNAANLIVLAADSGDRGRQRRPYRARLCRAARPGYRLSNSTACAILLCAVTTMIGFGSMVFSQSPRLAVVGQVLTMGVFCCLVIPRLFSPLLACLRPASQPNGEVLLVTFKSR